MVRLTMIAATGEETTLDAAAGQTLMEAVTRAGVEGMIGECGGNCACGTCRFHPDAAWRDRLGTISAIEQDMLEFTGDPEPGVRLACRIVVTEALDGLVARLPASQYSG